MSACSWSEFSEDYHRHFSDVSTQFATDMVRSLIIKNNDRILDLACGTGVLEFVLSDAAKRKLVPSDIEIVAIDYSKGMIQEMQNQLDQSPPVFKVTTSIEDGESLEGISDNSIDLVLSNFGVALFNNRHSSFKNAFRVLKPNGLFSFNFWDADTETQNLMKIVKQLFDLFPCQSSRVASRQKNEEDVATRMKTSLSCAGFITIKVISTVHSMVFKNFLEFWDFLTKFSPVVSQPIKDLNEVQREELMDQMMNILNIKGSSLMQPFIIDNRAFLITARKPE